MYRIMYGFSRFAENLNSVNTFNVQNCENSMGICVYQMYRLSGFSKNLNIQNYIYLTGNCVHQMYGVSGFAEYQNFADTLNEQNCVI